MLTVDGKDEHYHEDEEASSIWSNESIKILEASHVSLIWIGEGSVSVENLAYDH